MVHAATCAATPTRVPPRAAPPVTELPHATPRPPTADVVTQTHGRALVPSAPPATVTANSVKLSNHRGLSFSVATPPTTPFTVSIAAADAPNAGAVHLVVGPTPTASAPVAEPPPTVSPVPPPQRPPPRRVVLSPLSTAESVDESPLSQRLASARFVRERSPRRPPATRPVSSTRLAGLSLSSGYLLASRTAAVPTTLSTPLPPAVGVGNPHSSEATALPPATAPSVRSSVALDAIARAEAVARRLAYGAL